MSIIHKNYPFWIMCAQKSPQKKFRQAKDFWIRSDLCRANWMTAFGHLRNAIFIVEDRLIALSDDHERPLLRSPISTYLIHLTKLNH
jgi:hypothetical protein